MSDKEPHENQDLLAEAESSLAAGDILAAAMSFSDAKAKDRIWALFHQFKEEGNLENAVDILTFMYDPSVQRARLEIARETAHTQPDIAIKALYDREESDSERNADDEEAQRIALHVADSCTNIRVQIDALIICHPLERFPDRPRQLAGLVDALKLDIRTHQDISTIINALDNLGLEDEKQAFMQQMADSPTIQLSVEPDEENDKE